MKKIAFGCCAAIVGLCLACSHSQDERARERAVEAKQKVRQGTERARQELRRLGQAAKREALDLDQNVNEAMRGGQPDARTASERAAVKLGRAAMIAKVKAKLAADVGLSSFAGIDVDASGQIITLRGTVSSEEQKQEAGQAAMQVNGVTKVVNLLQVKS